MTIEVLISTMHQSNHCLLDKVGLECDAIVVNQCDIDSIDTFDYNRHKIKWINSTERGLSRSRNMALRNSTGDVCLIVDDDEELVSGYTNTIVTAFEKHPDAGVIGFQVNGIESTFKNYTGTESKVGYIRSMRMASVELAFKREMLKEYGIQFNEYIGAGTKYKMGEENALMFDCLSNGLKIYYVPELIGQVHIGDSTWFSGYDKEYFFSRGAVFTVMSKRWSLLLIAQFAIRKYKLYKDTIDFYHAIDFMLKGRKEYLALEGK